MESYFKLSVFCFLCFLCFSCRVSPFDGEPDTSALRHPSRNHRPIPLTSHLSPLTSSYASVHYRGSANVVFNTQSHVCQYNVVSVIDSFLYVQLSVAGIEIGRVLTVPNNILFVNKLQRNYYYGDYSVLEKFLDISLDFYTLQDIFNGLPIQPPENVTLSYSIDSLSYEYPFFNRLFLEYDTFSLKLDVKKVTFNAAPEVGVAVPRGFNDLNFEP